MELIERLASDELDMLDSWRQYYAFSTSASSYGDCKPMDKILQPWARAKSEHLAQLFGGELILSKDISYSRSVENLRSDIEDMVDGYSLFGRVRRNGHEFYDEYRQYMFYTARKEYPEDIYEYLCKLINMDTLATNIYDGPTFEIMGKNNKPLKIQHGCKAVRVLGKLADLFGIPGYEDFRLCHSQIFNQKTLNGKLSISIHPMDFMTMSDNECEWESCMNWRSEGSYRQGSVEMMNSPIVVVAYLESEEPMKVCRDWYWNSKKWRQLILVDPAAILAIKSYPYINENLTTTVIEWIAELAKENLGWEYGPVSEFNPDDYAVEDGHGNSFILSLETGSMYNDFGSAHSHFISVRNIDLSDRLCHGTLYLPYSGVSECMICGDSDPDLEDDSCLACKSCQSYIQCELCDEACDPEDYYIVDETVLCEYCYENRVRQCAVCEEEHLEDNLDQIYVLPHISPEMTADIRKDIFMHHGREDDIVTRLCDRYSYFICPDCTVEFEEKFLNPGCVIKRGNVGYMNIYYIWPEELLPDERTNIAWYGRTHTIEELNNEIIDSRYGEYVYLNF